MLVFGCISFQVFGGKLKKQKKNTASLRVNLCRCPPPGLSTSGTPHPAASCISCRVTLALSMKWPSTLRNQSVREKCISAQQVDQQNEWRHCKMTTCFESFPQRCVLFPVRPNSAVWLQRQAALHGRDPVGCGTCAWARLGVCWCVAPLASEANGCGWTVRTVCNCTCTACKTTTSGCVFLNSVISLQQTFFLFFIQDICFVSL